MKCLVFIVLSLYTSSIFSKPSCAEEKKSPYAFTCVEIEKHLKSSTSDIRLYRCENKEVICYVIGDSDYENTYVMRDSEFEWRQANCVKK